MSAIRGVSDDKFAKNILKEVDHIEYALKYFIDRTNQLERDLEHYKEAYENRVNEFIKTDRELKIKNEYFQLIHDIGYDYDGLEKPESLKQLIDELIDLANKGYKSDDKSVIYTAANGTSQNILFETIEGDKNDNTRCV